MTESQKAYLRSLFRAAPDRPYLVSAATEKTWTRGEVDDAARVLAGRLLREGLRPGDRIGFVARNSLELALLYLAAWSADAQVVPVNPQLTPDQIRDILAGAGVTLVLASHSEAASVRAADLASVAKVVVFADELDAKIPDGCLDLHAVIGSRGKPAAQIFGTGADDAVFLRIYTSGSTARPKGIDLTWAGLIGNERAFGAHLGVTQQNRFYNILPMSYLGGIHNLLLLPLANGGSVVIDQPLGGANLYGFWEAVQRFEIDTLWFTSAMLSMLMALRDDDDMSWIARRIRLGLVGMAPLQPATKIAFEQRFGFRLHENYAMSETAFATSSRPEIPYRPGSSGTLIEGVALEIVDDRGTPLPEGQTGEIRVRSPYLMRGYADAPQEDVDKQTPEGFLTGDLAHIDGGELFVTGRKKDLIIRGGLNIAPAFIESVMARCPEIREACVVGAPDPVYGEEVVAAVCLKGGPNADLAPVEAYLKEALPNFQRPKKLLVVESLPQGLTGKIDKKQVRRLFTEG